LHSRYKIGIFRKRKATKSSKPTKIPYVNYYE